MPLVWAAGCVTSAPIITIIKGDVMEWVSSNHTKYNCLLFEKIGAMLIWIEDAINPTELGVDPERKTDEVLWKRIASSKLWLKRRKNKLEQNIVPILIICSQTVRRNHTLGRNTFLLKIVLERKRTMWRARRRTVISPKLKVTRQVRTYSKSLKRERPTVW